MASITIRNLDAALRRGLLRRAARHGRSPEAEALDILRRAVEGREPSGNLGEVIRRRFAAHGGAEIDPGVRGRARPAPRLD